MEQTAHKFQTSATGTPQDIALASRAGLSTIFFCTQEN